MAKVNIKYKHCKECGEVFKPYNSLQVVCSTKCAAIRAVDKVWKKERKLMQDKARTRSEWLNIAQVTFNTYIRLRDKDLPCISCGCFVIKGHASHMFSVGSYPNLRFNEFNVNMSCIECNLHKHGNIAEYVIRLPKRIGKENFDTLLTNKDNSLKLTQEEIKELIEKYKKKIKELK